MALWLLKEASETLYFISLKYIKADRGVKPEYEEDGLIE